MNIGERIREKRKALGISQVQLADELGISKQLLYKYEKQGLTNMPLDRVQQFAKALNCTPEYLMGWEDDPNYQKGLAIGRAIASDETSIILEKIAQLSPEAKAELISFLDYLLSKNSVDNA